MRLRPPVGALKRWRVGVFGVCHFCFIIAASAIACLRRPGHIASSFLRHSTFCFRRFAAVASEQSQQCVVDFRRSISFAFERLISRFDLRAKVSGRVGKMTELGLIFVAINSAGALRVPNAICGRMLTRSQISCAREQVHDEQHRDPRRFRSRIKSRISVNLRDRHTCSRVRPARPIWDHESMPVQGQCATCPWNGVPVAVLRSGQTNEFGSSLIPFIEAERRAV